MIIFRYLSKQILQIMLAVTLILLVVALTSRFIQYLGQAVAGDISSDVLFFLMLYRLPDFLMVILPLALFLGILLAYGRMYAENEMIILLGSGYSERKLLLTTLACTAFAMLFVGALSLVLAPWGIRNIEQIKQDQEQLTEIDLIVPGQFQIFGEGDRVTYVERTSNRNGNNRNSGGRQLQNVFVAVSDTNSATGESFPSILIAESARAEIDELTGARFMRLENVVQYDGVPGQAQFNIGQFNTQALLLPEPVNYEPILEEESLRTAELFASSEVAHVAELQWRLSMILLLPVITLIAVPLSRVKPRQGQYSKLVAAALLYASYFILLQFAKEQVAIGEMAAGLGIWWVHILFIVIGLAIFRYPAIGNAFALGGSK